MRSTPAIFLLLVFLHVLFPLSLGNPPSCVIVNHASRECINGGLSVSYVPVTIDNMGECWGVGVIQKGASPYFLPQDWFAESGESSCAKKYPYYAITSVEEKKQISISSVILFLSSTWPYLLIILICFIPFVVSILASWRFFRKTERLRRIFLFLEVTSIGLFISLLAISFVSQLFYYAIPYYVYISILNGFYITLFPLVMFLLGAIGLILLRVKKMLGIEKTEKQN